MMHSFSSGSLLVSWDMTVCPVVSVPRGQDAVLSCSFTHPTQQHYSGKVTVHWLARAAHTSPFFSCSVKNDSMQDLSDCSVSGFKYSLQGDPRRGELSLLIRKTQLADNGTFICRVELDGWRGSFQKETHLYVTGKATKDLLLFQFCSLFSQPLNSHLQTSHGVKHCQQLFDVKK